MPTSICGRSTRRSRPRCFPPEGAGEHPLPARQGQGAARIFGAFPRERMNPNGGSIALGHPFGATGARILSQAVKELAAMPTGNAPSSASAPTAARARWPCSRRPDATLSSCHRLRNTATASAQKARASTPWSRQYQCVLARSAHRSDILQGDGWQCGNSWKRQQNDSDDAGTLPLGRGLPLRRGRDEHGACLRPSRFAGNRCESAGGNGPMSTRGCRPIAST